MCPPQILRRSIPIFQIRFRHPTPVVDFFCRHLIDIDKRFVGQCNYIRIQAIVERIGIRTLQKAEQPPIIDRACFAMSLLNINLCNPGIVPNHVQAAMPKQRLQGKNIAPGPQIGDRERMAKFVRIGSFTLSPGGDALDQVSQSMHGLKGRPLRTINNGALASSPSSRSGKISPESMPGCLAQIHSSPFPPFAPPSAPWRISSLPRLASKSPTRREQNSEARIPESSKVRMIA